MSDSFSSTPRRIVVVGAGLAGLACARTLTDAGHTVVVFDKGRSPGGRATSRREPDDRSFDHGAQFFTARSAWLLERVRTWEPEGVVARWSPRVVGSARPPEDWWVGTPRMSALPKHLARGLDVRLGSAVTRLAHGVGGWTVTADAPHTADAVVLAMPAAQAVALLAPVPALAGRIDVVVQTPCWAALIATAGPEGEADVYEDPEGPIAWAAREASKPGRPARTGEALWTLHASTAWSQAHLEDAPESVAAALGERFVAERLVGATVTYGRAHRWRYARGAQGGGPLVDTSGTLVVCGDWLESARVEGALTSGAVAAERWLAAHAVS